MLEDGTAYVDDLVQGVAAPDVGSQPSVSPGATAPEVQQIVDDAVSRAVSDLSEVDAVGLEGVNARLDQVVEHQVGQDGAIAQLAASVDGNGAALRGIAEGLGDQHSSDAVYTIVLDDSQSDVVMGAARVLCTEGLIALLLVAAVCGLVAFSVLSRLWGR